MAQAVSGPLGFLYLLTFAVTFAFGNLEGTFTAYLKQHFHFANDEAVAGGVFAYIGVLIVLIQGGAIRPLVKRFGEANLVVTGIGLMALGFLLFPLAPFLSVLLIGPMVPIAVGSGLNSPSLRALISRKATAQGAALGLSASFDSLARATGPATAGYLYKHVGQTAPYWCAGLVMSLCFLFALSRRREMTAGIAEVHLAPPPLTEANRRRTNSGRQHDPAINCRATKLRNPPPWNWRESPGPEGLCNLLARHFNAGDFSKCDALMQVTRQELNTGWRFQDIPRPGASPTTRLPWLPAEVPGHVHLDLLRAGAIPDPFYRLNERAVAWVDETDLVYETTFHVDAPAPALRLSGLSRPGHGGRNHAERRASGPRRQHVHPA